ncbi:AAA family ATPase [Paenibacillus xylanilyticus]|uniref:AAA family ATPase n=1 Tax=Paenibacillus xylanilyticus TaxID=248903 RepID=UPI0039A08794
MEIVYMWINDPLRSMDEWELNFGGPWRFSFDRASEELSVKKNKLHIPRFFVPEKHLSENYYIRNITALIGENGTGKTTLLNRIASVMSGGSTELIEFSQEYEVLLIFKIDGDLRLFVGDKLHVNNGNFQESGVMEIQKTELMTEDHFQDMSIVYFSNIFDSAYVPTPNEFRNLENISTNFLIHRPYFHSSYKTNDFTPRESEMIRYLDAENQLNFLIRHRNKVEKWSLPFSMPKKVTAKFEPTMIFYEHMVNDLRSYKDAYQLEKILNSAYDDLVYKNDAVSHFTLLVIMHIYFEIRNSPKEVVEEINKSLDYYTYSEKFDIYQALEMIQFITLKAKNSFQFYETLQGLYKFINYLLEEIEQKRLQIDRKGIHIDINDSISDFLIYYRNAFRHYPFLHFDWRDLSSGERALFNIISRFSSAINSPYSKIHKKSHVLILIDEGELYLHPLWQRRLINDLIEYFSYSYCEKHRVNLQIILTSHSPFIISDLPNDHIVFLRRSDNKIKTMDGLDDHKQTFAANINTLFSDAFFMSEGLIGEYAKKKINRLANYIVQSDTTSILEHRETIEKLIELIGEPILRNKLRAMYLDKIQLTQSSLHQMEKRILELEHELLKMKGKNDDKNS